ncbi:MAG: type I DNA topoisomerase, partial [Chloroflexi bacterium]|nr:type I DNA topoisomerase [Chloroflexota bacterium]
MSKDLVIVESPAKARTISRFLGKEATVVASMGHVRDLPEKTRRGDLGVEVTDGFRPRYEVMEDKRRVVNDIRSKAKDAKAIYLATDPDREGEAIAWHLTEAAGLDQINAPKRRVVFHEITEDAIQHAFKHPRQIHMELVNAQQARRILDRIVGYKLSPLLWKKIQTGLSAGRVQSAALQMVVTREREVQGFMPKEYWTIAAELAKHGQQDGSQRAAIVAELVNRLGAKGQIEIRDEASAAAITDDLQGAGYRVHKVTMKETRRRPAPPFITSTLQQEAGRKLKFSAKQTMLLAQQLYEGLPLGPEGSVGLITYMRTDSTHVTHSAVVETREFIQRAYGESYLPPHPHAYTKKVKGAQEAHEAIRPTSVKRTPDMVKPHLTAQQYKLYELVWQRMVACQMSDALYDATTIEAEAHSVKSSNAYLFKASRSVQKFPGFLALYSEGKDDGDGQDEAKAPLPPLTKGDALTCLALKSEQHFTKPPPRYTEATLIKALEENGIGRPSTYAPIISTLLDRDYVNKEEGRLVPQKLGFLVSDLLSQNFPHIVDLRFTARLEEELDEIARGETDWVAFLKEFYDPFVEELSQAEKSIADEATNVTCDKCGKPMVVRIGRYGRFLACTGFPECKNAKPLPSENERAPEEPTSEVCDKCGKPMVIRTGRRGKFLACTGFPACKNAKPLPSEKEKGKGPEEPTDEVCDKCSKPMVIRTGRRGKFLACTGFPTCKNAKPLVAKTGTRCPACKTGELVERSGWSPKTRKRFLFFGCSNFPTCDFSVRSRPLPVPCPECGGLLVEAGASGA